MKKAQGLSLNTIVIAAVALIVLVVLVLIFTGNIGGFGEGVREDAASCVGQTNDNNLYACKSECAGDWSLVGTDGTGYKDCDTIDMKCCVKPNTLIGP